MGVDYDYCKECKECIHSNHFPQCFQCSETDDICERCFDDKKKDTNAIIYKDDYFYICTYCLEKYSNEILIEEFYGYHSKCKITKKNLEKQLKKLKSKIPTEKEKLENKLDKVKRQLSILDRRKYEILIDLENLGIN